MPTFVPQYVPNIELHLLDAGRQAYEVLRELDISTNTYAYIYAFMWYFLISKCMVLGWVVRST